MSQQLTRCYSSTEQQGQLLLACVLCNSTCCAAAGAWRLCCVCNNTGMSLMLVVPSRSFWRLVALQVVMALSDAMLSTGSARPPQSSVQDVLAVPGLVMCTACIAVHTTMTASGKCACWGWCLVRADRGRVPDGCAEPGPAWARVSLTKLRQLMLHQRFCWQGGFAEISLVVVPSACAVLCCVTPHHAGSTQTLRSPTLPWKEWCCCSRQWEWTR